MRHLIERVQLIKEEDLKVTPPESIPVAPSAQGKDSSPIPPSSLEESARERLSRMEEPYVLIREIVEFDEIISKYGRVGGDSDVDGDGESDAGNDRGVSPSLRRAALGLFLLLGAPQVLLCQDAASFLNEANYQIRSLGGIIYQVVVGVLAIVALVSLITLGIKMQSSDREGTSKALGWCGGLLFCIVMALLVKNFLGI